MGRVRVHLFTTLDGVVDTPSWTADHGFPDDLAAAIGAITATCSDLLLGRRTYELFAPAWSARTDDDDPGASFFNGSTKHVVTSTLADPQGATGWGPARALAYSPGAVRALADDAAGDLYVSGSATLVRALLADGLVDELHLLTYPLARGPVPDGDRLLLLPGGGPLPLRLASAAALSNGVAHLVYAR